MKTGLRAIALGLGVFFLLGLFDRPSALTAAAVAFSASVGMDLCGAAIGRLKATLSARSPR